jgi:rhodanese-related sulfurtransferase
MDKRAAPQHKKAEQTQRIDGRKRLRGVAIMKKLVLGLVMVMFLSPAYAGDYQPVDVSKLPQAKQSKLGLYLSAPEAFKMKTDGGAKVVFIDVRTKGEFQFLGTTSVTDMNIPYMEIDDPASWDKKKNEYAMSPNSDFVNAVNALMARQNLTKTDPVILMCRSGDRSSRAADLLQQAGFTKVYSVVDGFEGDKSKDGRRDVNGWKNAGLPWAYKMTEGQAYIR